MFKRNVVLSEQAAVSYAVGVLFRLILYFNGCRKIDLDIVIYKFCNICTRALEYS